ncbi:hypothetical protein ACIRU3_34260 [Streptomyces sp. NPDC101151]|uniref:hypothetical protein n=1 Tax=Streptomyces sp. NPDC101151 TaxID=3366115 RepID=UPI00381FE8BD
MAERRPTDEERKKEQAEARTRSPKTSGGGFDVQPPHLHYTALVVRDGQFDYDKGATALVGVLNEYSQSAGTGWGADEFSAAYKSVNEKFLELWAKSVVSVGGCRRRPDGHGEQIHPGRLARPQDARTPAGCEGAAGRHREGAQVRPGQRHQVVRYW